MSASGEIWAGQIEKDPEIALLLGVFVGRWSLAEFSLIMAYLVATGSNRQEVATTALAATSSAEAKIQLVLKLVGVATISVERREAIQKAVKKLAKLCPQRNAFMHHLWGHRDDGKTVTIDYREPDDSKKATERTALELKALCNCVVDAALGICVATGSSWIDEAAAAELKLL